MSVEEEKRGNKTAEQLGQEIVDFVRGCEFGSPQYLAVSDYFELQRLYTHLGIEQRNVLQSKDEKGKLTWVSAVRVSEMKIALREHEISQREYTLSGYGRTHSRMNSWFENDLYNVASKEAKEKFFGDMTQHDQYVKEIYDKVEGTAEDLVWRKWDETSK